MAGRDAEPDRAREWNAMMAEPVPFAGRPERVKKRSFFAVLLCAHCTLTGGAALLTITLASAPTLFGIGLQWILPPFFIVGVFLIWLSTGRTNTVVTGGTQGDRTFNQEQSADQLGK